jgi:hypothetical protein
MSIYLSIYLDAMGAAGRLGVLLSFWCLLCFCFMMGWGEVGWGGVLGIQHVATLAHVVTLHKHGSDVTMIEDVAH